MLGVRAMEYLPRIAVYMKHNQPKRETCVASTTTGMANLSKPFDIRQGAIGESSSLAVIITLTKHPTKLFKGRRMYFSSCWQSPNLCVWLYAWRTQLPVDNDKVCLKLETLSIHLNCCCKVICVLSCDKWKHFPLLWFSYKISWRCYPMPLPSAALLPGP